MSGKAGVFQQQKACFCFKAQEWSASNSIIKCKIEGFACNTIFYRIELKLGPATANTVTGTDISEEFFHISSLIYVKGIAQSPYFHFAALNIQMVLKKRGGSGLASQIHKDQNLQTVAQFFPLALPEDLKRQCLEGVPHLSLFAFLSDVCSATQ